MTSEYVAAFAPGGLQVAAATLADVALIADAFRRGQGWRGASIILTWSRARWCSSAQVHREPDLALDPALDGVEAKLRVGPSVADLGCGCRCRASARIMARAYPACDLVGFGYHGRSIMQARHAAVGAGAAGHCRFDGAAAKDFEADGYDLVIGVRRAPDMGGLTGAAAHVLDTLAHDGT